ncbi:NACHT domain-containing protein [Streptomyces aureocirculatus]|uniref:NACHT domain-containing protein n=1 Tax=Streptomyces aureocirculatus TaxID=67275 RepID=UPI00068FAA1F|nr:ATP-binding protein [Streptomyces aureocirculatus]
MGRRKLLSFGDALVLLGGDPPAMAALDRALGGALNLATGGLSSGVLGMFDARGRILGLGRDAARGLGERLRHTEGRVERTRVLEAAHTVIVVLAFFDSLERAELPFSLDEVVPTRGEQLVVAGGRLPADAGLTDTLAQVDAPHPAPHLPYEDHLDRLRGWYQHLATRTHGLLQDLDVWARLDRAARDETAATMRTTVPRLAVAEYEELHARLVLEAPEFRYWSGRLEHQATRAELRRALAGLETLLAASAAGHRPPVDVAGALSRAHRSALDHRILDAQETPEGIQVPALAEGYLDPDFRVRAVDGQGSPADEEWWARTPLRQDLTEYLTGALTSEGLTAAPLLVLGQPGAGKSVLIRILAARLPSAGFLPVRVALRVVRADDEIQDQIEQAIREATGERATWTDLVRAAGAAVPVVLLDGFDELLQTTGVHQNDFLVRVARFQEREAEQGRPVLAVVTSRTAVADRARYPQGTVALRLEPFRKEQVQLWIERWNLTNALNFRALGLPPLTWDAVAPHRALAGQPLLLTMLALYQAAGNDLHGEDRHPLDEADLYEALLGSFARREVCKDTRVAAHEVEQRVEEELERLSLVAFAMLNRRRQWVSTAELDEDLAALLGRTSARASGLRSPLGQAEVALGRFFFVQRAQSIRDGRTLSTYEFLHATFGEYLAVRLAVRLLSGLLTHRPALSMGGEPLNDDLMFALLSFAPLSSRQMLRFARARVERLPRAERDALARLVVRAMGERELRAGQPYPAYLPRRLRAASRHGIYGANLVVLVLLLTGGTTAGALFPSAADAGSAWHRHALLWRSSLSEVQWTDLALSLSVRRTKLGEERDLEVAVRQGDLGPPEPVDAHWLFRAPREEGHTVWHRTYWNELWHKMDVSAGTNDGVALQALRPLFEALGPLVTTFTGEGARVGTSTAHDLLRLWLQGGSELIATEIQDLYGRIGAAFRVLTPSAGVVRRLVPVLTALLDRDLPRLTTAQSLVLLEWLTEDAPTVLVDQLIDHLKTHHSCLYNEIVHSVDDS